MDAAETALREYLQLSTDLRRKSFNLPARGFHYAGNEDLVLREGVYRPSGAAPADYADETGPRSLCFNNAHLLTLTYPDDLYYAEGWALSVIPVHHAWCVTTAGEVVDPTWGYGDTGGYLGIEVDAAFLRRFMQTRKFPSLLEDFHGEFELLRRPFAESCHV